MNMTIGEFAQLVTAFAAVGALVNSMRNSKKIEQVRQTTNGLAQRAEKLSHEAGVVQGKADEKANPTS